MIASQSLLIPPGALNWFSSGVVLRGTLNPWSLASFASNLPDFLPFGGAVSTEHPVILGSFCKEDGGVLKIGWANARDFFPVLPERGLANGKRLKRFLRFEFL
jgi:hypothetical protein